MNSGLLVFFVMTGAGAVFGMLFDLMRVVRSELGAGRLVTNITDALFVVLSGAVTVYLLIRFNDGVLRMYELIGAILGGVLYFFTLGNIVRRVFAVIFGFLLKFIRLILKIVLTPINFLYKILLGLFKSRCILLMNKRKQKDGKKQKK